MKIMYTMNIMIIMTRMLVMKTKMIIDNIRLSVCCFSLPPPLDNHDHDYANADDHNDEDDNDEDDLE